MTTGIERIVAAATGGAVDRIPVFCNLFDQGARELGMSITEYYSRGDHVAEAQLRLRERFGYDNVWSLFYVGREVEALGEQTVDQPIDGPPNIIEHMIKSYADIEALNIPDSLTGHPAFAEQQRCLEILHREVGGRSAICAYITSSMGLPVMLMGMERWLELLFTGPAEIRDLLLEKCHAYFVKEVEAYRRAGADTLIYSNPFASPETVPMKFFRNFSLPWIERDAAAVGAGSLIFYCGMSRYNRVIAEVLERVPFGCCYLSPLDDVAEGKRLVAGRGLTCGVINDTRLLHWSLEEIRAEVKAIIEAGKPGGKFAFGGSATPFHTPEESIRTMLEAAYEYGRC